MLSILFHARLILGLIYMEEILSKESRFSSSSSFKDLLFRVSNCSNRREIFQFFFYGEINTRFVINRKKKKF